MNQLELRIAELEKERDAALADKDHLAKVMNADLLRYTVDLQAANQRADDAVKALSKLGARVLERDTRESLKHTDLGEALDAGEAVILAIRQPKESGA